jgi:hypothetical protein
MAPSGPEIWSGERGLQLLSASDGEDLERAVEAGVGPIPIKLLFRGGTSLV